jgi:hypothetical protein
MIGFGSGSMAATPPPYKQLQITLTVLVGKLRYTLVNLVSQLQSAKLEPT